MSRLLLGIDVGSSFLKVAAFDERGRLIGAGQSPYETLRPAPGHIEQDPESWIDIAGAIIRDLIARGCFTSEQVIAVAPSARGSGAVFVDRSGRVLMNHWLDDRHRAQGIELAERFPLADDNRALGSKTLYFKQAHPELFAKLGHPLCVRDFLHFRMTGDVATDPSSGPRNLAMIWPADAWEWIGVPIDRVPPVVPHCSILGRLLPETARRLGLPAGIPVGMGGHDGACANAGAGAIAVGDVCLTMGTNGVARAIGDRPAQQKPWRGISAYHYLPGRWCCGGDAAYAGHTATWLARALGRDHAEMETAARRVPPGSNGTLFLPFLHGQVAPDRRPDARAAYIGMSNETGPADLYRATLEGVAFHYRSIGERLAEMGFGDGPWHVSGGGARNRLWMEIMAALLERPLLIGEEEEGSRGAAMFTAVALGLYPTIEACAAEWVRTVWTAEPDPALSALYRPMYDRFQRISEAVYQADR